jgi:hypothetical protein
MRYWILVAISLLGGILLINGGLKELMPVESRVFFIAGLLFLGVGRRMIQQKLHR